MVFGHGSIESYFGVLNILLGFICEFSYFSLGLVINAQGVKVLLGLEISHLYIGRNDF